MALSTDHSQISEVLRSATQAAADDLIAIAAMRPRERLPKEEQLRCSMYAALKPLCRLIQVEAGYFDADAPGGKSECDFRLWLSQGTVLDRNQAGLGRSKVHQQNPRPGKGVEGRHRKTEERGARRPPRLRLVHLLR